MVVLILQTGIITWNWPQNREQPSTPYHRDAPPDEKQETARHNANANKGGNIFLLSDALKTQLLLN